MLSLAFLARNLPFLPRQTPAANSQITSGRFLLGSKLKNLHRLVQDWCQPYQVVVQSYYVFEHLNQNTAWNGDDNIHAEAETSDSITVHHTRRLLQSISVTEGPSPWLLKPAGWQHLCPPALLPMSSQSIMSACQTSRFCHLVKKSTRRVLIAKSHAKKLHLGKHQGLVDK
ncbi:hypothetical protein C8R48DRAFT_763947 [Suillus tomentosus]|nr:hypothetical protein C8R48DRAFT_763947 [Suillus tomentosus]